MKKMGCSIAPLSFLLLAMFFSSYLHVGLCQITLDQLLPGAGFLHDSTCMQKLIPCQSYLKSQINPSEACCAPLKELNDNNTQCICNFINNPSLFQSLGFPRDDMLKLPHSCGIETDPSRCSNTAGSQGEGSVPDVDSAESTSSTKMITPYGVLVYLALLHC
ncbi:unnamed protein product [Sphenostylis stenocarpa]|uniref:Bifunctional inhibitor/plant lipid transfer protein/seed storage helical domain-containing protein n=1 Tax=Sphenostylis stenocarpa TaxID=92480 RepID=A0AA86SJB7_9FABA|nr:unnamed protein product [Sphenostylis stenocarpa]